MAKGLRAFRTIQISGPEVTPGTAVPAVEVFPAVMSIPLGDKVIHYPDQDINSLSRNQSNDFVVGRQVDGSLEGELDHRRAIWLFCNAIRGNVTPTQPAATLEPLAYLWTIEPSLFTTGNTPDNTNGIDTYTLEAGDNIQGYEFAYMFTRTLTITGAPNEPITFTQEFTADKVTETTITPALSLVLAQHFPLNLAGFYVDSSYANIGNTASSCLLRGFTWTLETMFTARYSADESLTLCGVNEDKKKVDLELIYYRDATSELEKDKYDARTTTYLRIAIKGATELDAAQDNVPYIYLDGAFRYTEWPEMDDEDGVSVEPVTLESVYDSVGGKEYGVTVLTDLAAYPS